MGVGAHQQEAGVTAARRKAGMQRHRWAEGDTRGKSGCVHCPLHHEAVHVRLRRQRSCSCGVTMISVASPHTKGRQAGRRAGRQKKRRSRNKMKSMNADGTRSRNVRKDQLGGAANKGNPTAKGRKNSIHIPLWRRRRCMTSMKLGLALALCTRSSAAWLAFRPTKGSGCKRMSMGD